MEQGRASTGITTRVFSDRDLENFLSAIGTHLRSHGYSPQVHSKSLLDYRAATPAKRGIFGKKLTNADVVIKITELPIGFSVDEGPTVTITVGLGFVINAPAPLCQTFAAWLAPYVASPDELLSSAGQFLAGRTFNKRLAGLACEHCGHVQEVTIPFSISRIEGNRGYGPGGSTTVVCSNSACNKSFIVNWDSIVVEIDMGSQLHGQQKTQSLLERIKSPQPLPSPKKLFDQSKGKTTTWLGFGESARVRGYDIPGGLIYVGSSLPSPSMGPRVNDACLIDPQLPVSKPGSTLYPSSMGYWPQYAQISADCRARYLRWLAGGRSDPNVDAGYPFLFFYGLERRLLIDGQAGIVTAEEREQIVLEIRRLRTLFECSNSFQGYSSGLLMAEWLLYRSDKPMPSYLSEGGRAGVGPFRVMLAQYSARGEPLPADIALRWLSLRNDYYKLRTPAKRCKVEFEKLFSIRYTEKCGDGVIVKPNKKRLSYQYGVASPSFRLTHALKMEDLPDPFDLKSNSLSKIKDVAEECTAELETYSRLMGKPESEKSRLAVCANLPVAIAGGMPEVATMRGRLGTTCADGPKLISAKAVYGTFEGQPPASFTKKDCDQVAGLVEAAGYGIAPHPSYHNAKIPDDGSIVVFPGGHGASFSPSREFSMMASILKLGALVAQIDKGVSPSEEGVLRKLVDEDGELTDIEKASLQAFLLWSLKTPQSAAGLKKSLSETSDAEKTAIGHILVAVASADGRIDPREVSQLEKLYVTLGMERERVAADLHTVVTGGEPVSVGLKDAEEAYAIPKPGEAPAKAFSLNDELIRIREEETREAQILLGGVFVGEEEPVEAEAEEAEAENLDPLAALEAPYRELLKRLLVESEWAHSAIEAVCKELGLMPDGAMEVLNEWAFENAEAPLIDFGEPVYIDIELARGIIDG